MHLKMLLLVGALASGAGAQVVNTQTDCAEVNRVLDLGRGTPLPVYFEALRPSLTYSFRFYAGYRIQVPYEEFRENGPALHVLARVTPADGAHPPVCFFQAASREQPMTAPDTTDYTMAGGFFLGRGRYRMDLAVVDSAERLYRKQVTFTAAPKRAERRLPLLLDPGVVQPLERLSWTRYASRSAGPPRRLTVLFHVASLYGPRTTLRIPDQALLLSSLATVLSGCAFDDIRLIAFNLDQQRELFRQNGFNAEGFHKLARTVYSLNLNLIPIDNLKTKEHDLDLLDSLIRKEWSAPERPDAILFLGPYARDESKWRSLPCETGHDGPRLFYFQHRVDKAFDMGIYFNPAQAVATRPTEFPDTLERLVRACSGQVYRIHTPAELSEAIGKLNAG